MFHKCLCYSAKMKFILIFIFCLITRSCYGLKTSHHYKFTYFSNFKTGIPQDGTQASGVSMKAVLDVYLEDQDGIAIFKLSDIRTVALKEDLGCNQEIEFPDDGFQPLKSKEISSSLEQPFRANLRGSQPFSIEYEETEHRWLSNVRKGIASIFKNEILKGNFETQEKKDSISSLFHEGHLVNIFSVEEETIFGKCKVSYEIHEIKDGFISTENDSLPTQKSDSEEGLWRVVRSVNFGKCKDKVIFNTHTTNEKRNKGEYLGYTRSSVSTYVLRGLPGHFHLYSAVVEGIMTFPLSPFDEHEEAHATAKQKLLLIDESANEELPTLGSNLKHSTTWMHEVWSSYTLQKDTKPHPWIIYSDENNFNHVNEVFGSQEFNSDQISEVKVKILQIIETSSKVLTDLDQETKESQWQSLPDSLNIVSHYFKMLSKEDIIKIFDHIFERNVKLERRLIIDTASSSESHNAFEAIMDYITEDKLQPFEVRNVFMNLATFDGTLNITRLMDYVLQVKIGKSDTTTVYLNFANYLSEFCINKVHNYNPARTPFNDDCVLVLKRFIPHLKEIIYNETLTWERPFAIRVLDVLRTSFSFFDILTPLIDGRVESSNLIKAMALSAFKNWTPDRDSEHHLIRKPVMDLLKDVYTNYDQDFQVRATALLSYITWQPSTSFWYDLAQSTWHEPSGDYSSFTSNLIKLYAEEKVPALEKQWKDASSALKFTKTSSRPQVHIVTSLFDILFKNYAKLYMVSLKEKKHNIFSNLIIEVLTKGEGFSLLKFENFVMHTKEEEADKYYYNRYDSHPSKFFETFSKEINIENYPYSEYTKYQVFFQIFGDAPNTMPPRITYNPINQDRDSIDMNVHQGGRFFKFFEGSNFFPNELGLPTFTFNAMPTTFSLVTKTAKDHEPSSAFQILLRASSVYSRGVAVHLPWTQESYSAFARSSLEVTLPLKINVKRHPRTEESIFTSMTYFRSAYKKKFPVFRLSNTPMTGIFSLDPSNKNPQESLQIIKKFNVKERVISEVHPFTGIKYDLVMKADSKTGFGLHDFQPFPKLPFSVFNFELYLNPEESETKELEFIDSHGVLSKSEEATEKNLDSNKEYPTISISDTFIERSQKLKNLFGFSLGYSNFKFNFNGEKERSYEMFFAQPLTDGRPKRLILGFSRSAIPLRISTPSSFCIDFGIETPSRVEKDSAFTSHRNISQEVKLKILLNCSHPILKANALYRMSEEGREATSGKCNSKYDNTEFDLKRKLYFDTIDIDVFYATNKESYDFALTKDVLDSLKNWINFPSIKKFTDNTENENIRLRIYRNTTHNNWDLILKTSSDDVLLATFSDSSNNFKILSGVSEFDPDTLLRSFVAGNRGHSPGGKCTLLRNSVTTFDGVHYNYQPSPCWTLASHTRPYMNEDIDETPFLIRAPKGTSNVLDFKIILFKTGIDIEFSNNELKVNGTVVDKLSEDSPDLKTIEENMIYKSRHHYFIYPKGIRDMSLVIVSNDKIEIYKRKFGISPDSGICGNKDGNIISEFIGPKLCVYNDAQLFAASWTGQSDDCDADTLKEYRKGVDDFQAQCKLYPNQLQQDVHINQRCLYYGWKISTINENKYCISAKPLPFCLNTCKIIKHKSVKVTYKCWQKENAPDFLRSSVENKIEIVGDPVFGEPYFYEHSYTDIATLCKQF